MYRYITVIAAATLVIGCASRDRASFHVTDPTFQPRGGAMPRVIVERAELPPEPMHSVGVIEVTATTTHRARELAAEKGRELGCSAIVEHELFIGAASAGVLSGARIVRVHGGGHHVERPSRRPSTVRFDCVLWGRRA